MRDNQFGFLPAAYYFDYLLLRPRSLSGMAGGLFGTGVEEECEIR